jgi:4-hydroxy-tetrahydrodipicolinate synthase
MNMMGMEVGGLRRPLTEMEDVHKAALRKILIDFGITLTE